MQERGTCAYCGTEGVLLTIEHVFPESWYPDGTAPSTMLTVPACGPCNAAYDKIEKRMFAPLALSLPDDPRVATIVARAMRSADPSVAKSPRDAEHRQKRGDSIMRRSRIVGPDVPIPQAMWTPAGRREAEFITDTGEAIVGSVTLDHGWENLEALAIKLFRGCYFAVSGRVLGDAHPVWAKGFHDDPGSLIASWQRVRGAVTAGAFPFQYVIAEDEQGSAGGFFILWNFAVVFASNLPRAHEESVLEPAYEQVDWSSLLRARTDDVVPVSAKAVRVDRERTHLLDRDLACDRILSPVEFGSHNEPATCGRVADQVDDGLVAA